MKQNQIQLLQETGQVYVIWTGNQQWEQNVTHQTTTTKIRCSCVTKTYNSAVTVVKAASPQVSLQKPPALLHFFTGQMPFLGQTNSVEAFSALVLKVSPMKTTDIFG